MPLAKGGALVPIGAQDFRKRGRCPGNDAGVAIPVDGAFCDGPEPTRVGLRPVNSEARVGEQIEVV